MPSALIAFCPWAARLLLVLGAVLFNPVQAAAGPSGAGVYRLNAAFDLAVLGGRNLGDAYFAAHSDSDFADLDVFVAGPLVREVSRSFDA